jgi:tyrosyl-tRNA synthetase
VHGATECANAVAASKALFGQGDLAALDEPTLAAALAEAGCITVHGTPESLPTVVDLMADAGITTSKSDARRAIAGGGAYLNNRKVSEDDARPQASDLLCGRFLVLRRGRRTVAGVELITD